MLENVSNHTEAANCVQRNDAIFGWLTAMVDFMKLFSISMNIVLVHLRYISKNM